jgi:hypothetical protein
MFQQLLKIHDEGESSDEEIIEWRSVMQPQQAIAGVQPQTPPAPQPKSQATPPQMGKKKSYKSLQRLIQHHTSPNAEGSSAQPKLEKLRKQLHIDMAFMALAEYAYVITTADTIPQTFEDVMESAHRDEWLQAVQKEHSALQEMNCFGPQQDLPEGKKATNTSYLFVIKSDGQRKARLVFRNNPLSNGMGKMTITVQLWTGL